MSYGINQITDETNFSLKKEDAENMLKDLKEFAKDKKFDWADEDEILEAETIEECFEGLGYSLKEENENFVIDYYNREKLGDDEKILEAIAKYIPNNSFIQYVGEDGEVFRLVFSNGKCEWKYPKLIWN